MLASRPALTKNTCSVIHQAKGFDFGKTISGDLGTNQIRLFV
jgi:hypothetical protein